MLRYFVLIIVLFLGCESKTYDLVIRNGMIVDGTGAPPYKADVAVKNGRIEMISSEIVPKGEVELNAEHLVISPGFIDMLSWACGPILYNSLVPSVVQQGITTAIFGEGWSMGPINDRVRSALKHWWSEYHIDYQWETLYDYLKLLETQGTAINIASYVGATSLRLYVMGSEDRPPTKAELAKMKHLLRQEMERGALGLASSLVYAPAFYATTEELIELAKVAAEYGGVYASHIRSEGSQLLPAIKEFIEICRKANIKGEIYHFKAAGKTNWAKLDSAITLIEQAQKDGLKITADMYPYTAAATGLRAMIPPWEKEGGDSAMVLRLKNNKIRARIKSQILNNNENWENFYQLAGGGKNILISYLSEKNRSFQGKTLADIAKDVHKDELDALFDLLVDEKGGGGGIYFLMSEKNVLKKIQLPWVSFCTDEDAYEPTGLMSKRHPHPRAYGTFPRILGKYVREDRAITLSQAIFKMSGLPAQVLGLTDRGILKKGKAADIVIFDPDKIKDKATYLNPHQFPEGIHWVIVNGQIVVEQGNLTGKKPGQALFRKNRY